MKILIKSSLLTLALLTTMSSNLVANENKVGDPINGVQVWADVCARCHNVRPPEDFSKRAWEYSMNHMRIRAGLTGQETRDILAFLRDSKTQSDAQ